MTHSSSQHRRSADVTFEPMDASTAEILGPLMANIDPWAHYKYTSSALTAYLATQECDAPRFAIKANGSLAGAVGIKKNWLRGPYLQFLGVLPIHQNQGIGKAVLAWFEKDARETHAQNIWVLASDFNARALSFYEKHGFSRIATLLDLVVDDTSEILLRKRLASTDLP
jgi:ribosomal protein S18 acetylase RimI-like enzyme